MSTSPDAAPARSIGRGVPLHSQVYEHLWAALIAGELPSGTRLKDGDWATRLGFGIRTGIPLNAETKGNIPNDDYSRKVHGRKMLDGDLANFSIGQGDVLVTPLQMAQSMATIGNGGALVVIIHGGPTIAYHHAFDLHHANRLLAEGFSVLLPNPRGSVGRGASPP